MSLLHLLVRCGLGRRYPIVQGECTLDGITTPITIRRDAWGIPHIEAGADADVWFGLGFCHAQDRAFQLETLLRIGRGTMAELVGPSAVPLDRLSRRIGFYRSAQAQLSVLDALAQTGLTAYTNGINAGYTEGLPHKPHEFSLLGGEPSPWNPADVLAYLKLSTFLLPSNWDVELARLRILLTDGPDALHQLDPVSSLAPALPNTALPALDALMAELALFRQFVQSGGGSNNWAIAGSRTLSGKPLLANDPHLSPTLPAPWYLAHVQGPSGAVAGATFVGAPTFPIGHNGHACWGVTAGLTDVTDFFQETVGPDGRSVREADGSFTVCEMVQEVIAVKGRAPIVEDVLITPRGPIVSPLAPELGAIALSLRAVWLDPLPLRGFLDAHTAQNFSSFRQSFREWPVMPLNLLYADSGGTIGYQLAGQLPQRRSGHGLIPLPADAENIGWETELVPFESMPHSVNPEAGFLASANTDPRSLAPTDAFLGRDFMDPYRAAVIRQQLANHSVGWRVSDCQTLQMNQDSIPWAEIQSIILAREPQNPQAREAWELLAAWDGCVNADSPAATVWELFLAAMATRVARSRAPQSWRIALGASGLGAIGHNLFADRRVAHLVSLLREQPAGWFDRSWPDEMEAVLEEIVPDLRKRFGPGPQWWQWGDVRPLMLKHPVLGKIRGLGWLINRGPLPIGGDQNTVSQAGCRPTHPTAPTHTIANLRTVFDTADFSESRFVLAGGQSGNPFSPHFDDQLPLWLKGESVPIPWTMEQVLRATRSALRLTPSQSTGTPHPHEAATQSEV
ncbi:MAG: penicillin acylase family protein [Bacteroidales bacterium]|nr:penicillin acylase family protein [Bacteroidales bacterium]